MNLYVLTNWPILISSAPMNVRSIMPDEYNTLGKIAQDVLKNGEGREISRQESERINFEYRSGVASKIEQVRTVQRRAFGESKNLTLA